jgi:hypothetical protein
MTRIPRPVLAAVGTTALALGAGLHLGVGAAVASPAAASGSTGEVSPTPQTFSFDRMSPGQTRSTIVDLASTHPTDGTVVGVQVTTSGELGDSLSTSIEACASAWAGDECPDGAVVLIEDWRGSRSGAARHEVRLPAGDTTALRVSVTLDESVPLGATGSVRYDLSLQGEDGASTGDPDPGHGAGDGAGDGMGEPGAAGEDGTGGHEPGGPLASTGAQVWGVAAASGLLVGIGAALVRRRGRRQAHVIPPST